MSPPKGHAAYNILGEGGRPLKYTPEVLDKMADDLMDWLKEPAHIFFDDFCLEMDLHPKYMSKWAAENDRFREAYEIAKARQLSRLKNGALLKVFEPGFTKFLMVNNHGYSEKTESKVNVQGSFSMIYDEIKGTTEDLVKDKWADDV